MPTLVDAVKHKSTEMDSLQQRNPYGVLSHLMSEVGELAQEISIAQGDAYKPHGKDHIVGEAVDVMLCVLDLIHVCDPSITEDDLIRIATNKGGKWVNAVQSYISRESKPDLL
jgi:NTP pyrophosphatase (non-canonical NTP hydrolase)